MHINSSHPEIFDKEKYRRKDDKELYVCKLVRRSFWRWEWEVVDIVPTNGDAFSLATKIECDERKLAIIYNYINNKKNVIRHPGVSFKVDLLGAPRITANMISTQKRIDNGEYPTEHYPGTFKTWWQRRKEQEEYKQTQEQCKKCDFYSGQKELLCAVHPRLKHNCTDFQPKQNRPPKVLEITTEKPKKRFRFTECTQEELIYCYLVALLEDWHHEYFSNSALVEHYQSINECYGEEDSIIGVAARLPITDVRDLQERLQGLCKDDQWEFLQAINVFVAIG